MNAKLKEEREERRSCKCNADKDEEVKADKNSLKSICPFLLIISPPSLVLDPIQ